MSVRISMEFPEEALSVLREAPEEFGQHVREATVAKWYEMGIVSQSKAAEILALSRAELLRLLGRYRVTACQVGENEYTMEFRP